MCVSGGHCKQLAPVWKEVAEELIGFAKIAAVDCDEHKDMAGKFKVQGFPTIKVFGSESTIGKNGKPTKVPEEYEGSRSKKAIIDLAFKKLANYVKSLDSESIDGFLSLE